MFKVLSQVTSGVDKTNLVKSLLDELGKKQVLVGIPEQGNTMNGTIKNAELLYILSHGVRSKEMIEEMNASMGIDADGMPFTQGFNDMLSNMGNGMPYSQAYQLFLHSHGSPLWRIPPRPVLEPAIEYNREAIAKQLQTAAQTALDGQDPSIEIEKAGMMGQNFARDWFTNPANQWLPNSPRTIEMKGSDNPMIDTGEMRKAIVYVVKDGGAE